jgi:GH35 family endo-1,4-beta-xylanase
MVFVLNVYCFTRPSSYAYYSKRLIDSFREEGMQLQSIKIQTHFIVGSKNSKWNQVNLFIEETFDEWKLHALFSEGVYKPL